MNRVLTVPITLAVRGGGGGTAKRRTQLWEDFVFCCFFFVNVKTCMTLLCLPCTSPMTPRLNKWRLCGKEDVVNWMPLSWNRRSSKILAAEEMAQGWIYSVHLPHHGQYLGTDLAEAVDRRTGRQSTIRGL